jgi:hypothetical protein
MALCHLYAIILPIHLLPLFATYLHSPPILSSLLYSSVEVCFQDVFPLRVLVTTSMYYVLRCVVNFIMDPIILCHCVFQNFEGYINFKFTFQASIRRNCMCKHNKVEKSLQAPIVSN